VIAAPLYHQTFRAMGTRLSLVLPGVDEADGAELGEVARSLVARCEHLLSRFDACGPLYDLNVRAATEPVAPPAALWEVLHSCREHWQRTAGRFDITLAPVARVWREALQAGRLPAPDEIEDARGKVGFSRLVFDDVNRTVRFAQPGMSVDLGGFGKGWTLDVLRAEFIRRGVSCAFFSFGESSVSVIGRHPLGRPWPVGIADVFAAGKVRHTFELLDTALSTSGNSPGNTWGGNVRFGHIIDPLTLQPVTGYRTLSVVCATAAEAEVLSTALLVAPGEVRAALREAYNGAEVVEFCYDSAEISAAVPPLRATA
jgi:thiamine biosynthesis lipoprotein